MLQRQRSRHLQRYLPAETYRFNSLQTLYEKICSTHLTLHLRSTPTLQVEETSLGRRVWNSAAGTLPRDPFTQRRNMAQQIQDIVQSKYGSVAASVSTNQ